MHEKVIGHGSEDPSGRCYKIRAKKTRQIITKQHMTATPISTDDYFRFKVIECNSTQKTI